MKIWPIETYITEQGNVAIKQQTEYEEDVVVVSFELLEFLSLELMELREQIIENK